MDEMLEGESYDQYVERFKDKGLSEKELHDKAIEAWYTRRAELRRNK